MFKIERCGPKNLKVTLGSDATDKDVCTLMGRVTEPEKVLSVVLESTKITDPMLLWILKKFTEARCVRISKCEGITGENLVGLFKNVTRLSLNIGNASAAHIVNLFKMFPNLWEFTMLGCTKDADLVLRALRICCPKIVSLHLLNASKVCRLALWDTLKKYPNMTKLVLSSLEYLDDHVVEIISKSVPKLRTLDFHSLFNKTPVPLSKMSIDNIAKLTELRVLKFPPMTILPSLHLLSLGALHKLKTLFIPKSNLCGKVLRIIAPWFPRLRFLVLSNCANITDEGLKALGNLRNLRKIFLDGCGLISDEGVIALTRLPRLCFLNLSHCEKITDAAIKEFDSSPIEYLHLDECPRLTDEMLVALASQTSKIKEFSISSCDVTTIGVGHFLSRVPKLMYLMVNNALVDNDVFEYINNSKSLELIDLSRCPNVTTDGLRLLTPGPKLTEIIMTGEKNLVPKLKEDIPRLANVELSLY